MDKRRQKKLQKKMAASAHTILCEFFTLFGDVWWHNLFCFQLVRTGKRRKNLGGNISGTNLDLHSRQSYFYILERMIPFLAQFDNYLLGIVTPLPGARDISNKKGWVKKEFCPIKDLFQLPKNVIILLMRSVKASYIDRI